MVRVHFFVIPAAVAAIGVEVVRRRHGARMCLNRLQHRMTASEVLFRQIAAVGTRIGDQLMGFVELLAGVQHRLRAQPVALCRFDLQAGERERQRRALAFALIVVAGDQRRLARDAGDHVIRQRAMQQPPLFILPGFAGVAGHPAGDEALLVRRDDMGFDFEVIFRDEVFDLFVTAHHQTQHRRLHAAHRQHAVIARVAPQQRPGARHIDTVKPVGARARQRRNAERNKFAVFAQSADRPLHRLRVQVVDQAALNPAAFFRRQLQIVEHFVHQQLTFAIGVARMHHFAGLLQQLLNNFKLLRHRGTRLQLPFLRDDRQVGQRPARVAAVVTVRLRLLQQVPDAPGDDLIVAAGDKALSATMGLGQHIGNRAAKARFFRNKQTHESARSFTSGYEGHSANATEAQRYLRRFLIRR